MVDALGFPVEISLTEGQVHDVKQAPQLLSDIEHANVIADKGYDSDAIVQQLHQQQCVAVIPSRTCRKEHRTIDKHLYKERFLVECFFQKIKRHRRIAMRYEKLACNFLSMVMLAAALLWAL